MTKRDANKRIYNDLYRLLEIEVPVNHIIGLSSPKHADRQGVANSIFISKENWKKAGIKRRRT